MEVAALLHVRDRQDAAPARGGSPRPGSAPARRGPSCDTDTEFSTDTEMTELTRGRGRRVEM